VTRSAGTGQCHGMSHGGGRWLVNWLRYIFEGKILFSSQFCGEILISGHAESGPGDTMSLLMWHDIRVPGDDVRFFDEIRIEDCPWFSWPFLQLWQFVDKEDTGALRFSTRFHDPDKTFIDYIFATYATIITTARGQFCDTFKNLYTGSLPNFNDP